MSSILISWDCMSSIDKMGLYDKYLDKMGLYAKHLDKLGLYVKYLKDGTV